MPASSARSSNHSWAAGCDDGGVAELPLQPGRQRHATAARSKRLGIRPKRTENVATGGRGARLGRRSATAPGAKAENVTIPGLHRKVSSLQGPDSPHDDPLEDFPLRETDSARTRTSNRLTPDATPVEPAADPVYAEPGRRGYGEPARTTYDEPVRMTYAEPPLFASVAEPALFGSAEEEPRRRSGLSIWFAAAASLVLGIVIGFASGYRAGQGSPAAPAAAEAPEPTSGAASSGQPFSESTVPDPARVEPKEDVPSPSPRPAPSTPPRQQAAPAPAAAAPRQVTPPVARPTITAPGAAVVEEKPPLTGPASLQVVSRPAGAEVIVDGKSVGRTPLSMEMSPGAHDVRLSLPGFKGWATTVDVKAGSTTRVSGSLEQ